MYVTAGTVLIADYFLSVAIFWNMRISYFYMQNAQLTSYGFIL